MNNLKIPPHSLDSERALIAACLIRAEIIPGVMAALQSDDFYKIEHQHIVKALFELKKNSDLVTVWQWLSDHHEQYIDKDYLMKLVDSVSTSAGWKYYADIIKEKAQRRRVLDLCGIAMAQAYGDAQYPIEEIMSGLKSSIREIQRANDPEIRSNLEILQAIYKDIESRAENQNYFVGIKTGLDAIDNNLSGMEPKTTIYIAARPSIGKTALAVNIATNVALAYPKGKVLYYYLESNAEALVRRQIAIQSGIFLTRIRRGQIEPSQWDNLNQTIDYLSKNTAISILDHTKFRHIENLAAHSESVAMDNKISLIVIDHIQKMTTRHKTQNRHLELSHISNIIQDLAKDLNTPILVLCQLGRGSEGRTNPRPALHDLKESGDLEQNADCVWGLYRTDKESPDAELNQLKGRDTGTFSMQLNFDPKTQRFSDPAEPHETWQEKQDQKDIEY